MTDPRVRDGLGRGGRRRGFEHGDVGGTARGSATIFETTLRSLQRSQSVEGQSAVGDLGPQTATAGKTTAMLGRILV